jgi:hypothetical protein
VKRGSHENVMVSISSGQSGDHGKTKISIVHTRNNQSSKD